MKFLAHNLLISGSTTDKEKTMKMRTLGPNDVAIAFLGAGLLVGIAVKLLGSASPFAGILGF